MTTRRNPRERGAALLEFALVLPIMLILVLGIVDFGRLAYTQINLNEAVQDGSIYASTNPGDPTGVIDRVVESVDSPAIAPNSVYVKCVSGRIKVTVEHPVTTITPMFLPNKVTLTAGVVADSFSGDDCVASS